MINWFRNIFGSPKKIEIIYKVEISIPNPITIRLDGQRTDTIQVSSGSGGLSDIKRGFDGDHKGADSSKLPVELRIDLPLPEAEFGQEVK